MWEKLRSERSFESPVIIAEIGVNHNGSLELAKQMTLAARQSGADIVKFQTFVTDKLVGKEVDMAEYQKTNMGKAMTQYEMIKALELSADEMHQLYDYCTEIGAHFLSSAAETESVDLLRGFGVNEMKVSSADLTNIPFLRYLGRNGFSVILSTGMGSLAEVDTAVTALLEAGCSDITLLHCTTEYPAPFGDVNLRAMETLRSAFGLPVGYSDHTCGYEVAVGAAALGAFAIEKHFTTDKSLPGPDQKASMSPEEFAALVSAVRNVSQALGSFRKRPAKTELVMRPKVRKSLVASQMIPAGSELQGNMVDSRRMGGRGIPAEWIDIVQGAVLKRAINAGELLTLDLLEFSRCQNR